MTNKTLLRIAVSGLLFAAASAVHAQARVDIPHTFQAGQPARAAEVNANFTALQSSINSMQLPEALAWKGQWQNGVSYLENDLVEFGGSAYLCIAGTSGMSTPIDTTKWQLFAARGSNGSNGAAGPVGPVGAVGAVGPQGLQGVSGTQGLPGWPGPQGVAGPPGAQGSQGMEGPQGPKGDPGVQGLVGPTGPTGASPATLVWKGQWQAGLPYVEKDLVEFGGSAYVCLVDTAGVSSPIDPTTWQLFAAKGAEGSTGVQGPEGPAGVVGEQGPQGLQGARGLPGWPGPQGEAGPQGADGPQGPAGPQGIQGPSGVLTDDQMNTAGGFRPWFFNADQDGSDNTTFGAWAMTGPPEGITGSQNTALGSHALRENTSGIQNVAVGVAANLANRTGNRNTVIGAHARNQVWDGSNNIALGHEAGADRRSGDFNIDIGARGVSDESNSIRIGEVQTTTYIAGIYGVTTGVPGSTVVIDANGQLGTISSSGRYKEDIHPMADASERLAKLRPVTFRYKTPNAAGEKPIQYGLIAEEVAQVFPDLVVYDKNSQVETVAYHLLTPLLLNELQKERQTIAALSRQVAEQDSRLAALSERVDEVKVLKAQIEELKRLAMPTKVAAQ